MVVVRTVSGSFAILSGTSAGVLSSIFHEGIRGNSRICGFTTMGEDLIVLYSLH